MPQKSSEQPTSPFLAELIELMERNEIEDGEIYSEPSDSLTPEKFHTLARIGGMIRTEEGHLSARDLYQRLLDFIGECWQKDPERPQVDIEILKTRFPESIRAIVKEIVEGTIIPARPLGETQ